jgi:ankyrin repeat protein
MDQSGRFIEAVEAGDADEVERLLNADTQLAWAQGDAGVSGILIAAYHGHMDIAQEIGAVKEPDIDIFEAAVLGEVQRVSELIEQFPEVVSESSPDGYTALQLAAFFGQKDIVEILLNAEADPNVLSENAMHVSAVHAALGARNVEIARVLLAAGGSPTDASGEGWTPLHYAAANGEVELTEELLLDGASPQALNQDGKTPLELAIEKGRTSIVERMRNQA